MVVKYVSSLRSFPNTMDVKVKLELRPLSKLSKGKYIIGHFVVAIALVPQRFFARNHSYENVCHLHVILRKSNSFSSKNFCTRTSLEVDAKAIRNWTYRIV